MDFIQWLNNLMSKGLGFVTQRYYSIYRAQVTDNQDPEQLGRVQILCAQVGHTKAPSKWVWPCMPGAGNKRGMFFVPEINDTVWVSFFEGDPNNPEVYLGGWYGLVDDKTPDVPTLLGVPSSLNPEKKGFTTRAGHSLVFNDEAGKESVTLLWNKPDDSDESNTNREVTGTVNSKKNAVLTFDKNGGLMIKTPSSHMLQIDETQQTIALVQNQGKEPINQLFFSKSGGINLLHKSGASVVISDKAITISGNTGKAMDINISGQNVNINGGGVLLGGQAIDFAVLGLKLIAYLATHTHSTGVGPSGPPIIPPNPAQILSKTVKLQA